MTFRLLFLALLLPISLIFGFLSVVGGAALHLQLRTLGYATTTGTVTHSEVVTEPESENTQSANIRYTYEQAGRTYEGRAYRYGAMHSGRDTKTDDDPIAKKPRKLNDLRKPY